MATILQFPSEIARALRQEGHAQRNFRASVSELTSADIELLIDLSNYRFVTDDRSAEVHLLRRD
jgi:hypothetical protein